MPSAHASSASSPPPPYAGTHPPHYDFWPPGAPKSLTYPQTSVFYNFEVSARRFPDRPFTVFYGHETSWREAAAQIDALASFLTHRMGVARGDRVIVDLQNSPQFMLAFYAVLRADAVVVPVNPMSKVEELRHYVEDSDAVAAIIAQDTVAELLPMLGTARLRGIVVATYSDYLPAGEAAADDLAPPAFVEAPRQLPEHPATATDLAAIGDAGAAAPLVAAWTDALAWGATRPPPPHLAGPDDMACLPYTSGSTGWPKGCIHTHATMMATCVMVGWWKTLSPASVSLATAPFFHVTGLVSCMNAPIYMGATSVILPRWDPVVAARLIERWGVSNWTNVPTMVVDVLSHPVASKCDLSSLRHIGGGGAAMPEAIAQLLHDRYGLSYLEGYGMTETMSPTHMNPWHRPKKQCLGIPAFDVEARVVDPDTLQTLPPGETGEILMSGPQVMKGYWKHPEATAEALVELDGRVFMRSGDLGHMDADGYYFLSDRLKRMINAAGFKVWPAEVENFFYKHPAVRECCIVAAPDERRGETVKLFVARRPGHEQVDADALIAWARERMAAYKVPRKVEFVDALPRTSSGKIFWRQLQDREFGRG